MMITKYLRPTRRKPLGGCRGVTGNNEAECFALSSRNSRGSFAKPAANSGSQQGSGPRSSKRDLPIGNTFIIHSLFL